MIVSDKGYYQWGLDWIKKNILQDLEYVPNIGKSAVIAIGAAKSLRGDDITCRGDLSKYPEEIRPTIETVVDIRREVITGIFETIGVKSSEVIVELAEMSKMIPYKDILASETVSAREQLAESQSLLRSSYHKVVEALLDLASCAVVIGDPGRAAMIVRYMGYMDMIPEGVKNIVVVDSATANANKIVEKLANENLLFMFDPDNWKLWKETFPKAMLLSYWEDASMTGTVAGAFAEKSEFVFGFAEHPMLKIRPFENMPWALGCFCSEQNAMMSMVDSGIRRDVCRLTGHDISHPWEFLEFWKMFDQLAYGKYRDARSKATNISAKTAGICFSSCEGDADASALAEWEVKNDMDIRRSYEKHADVLKNIIELWKATGKISETDVVGVTNRKTAINEIVAAANAAEQQGGYSLPLSNFGKAPLKTIASS